MNELIKTLWEFCRGDFEPSRFEGLLCEDKNFEKILPKELYFSILQENYRDLNAVYNLRLTIYSYLKKNHPEDCQCKSLRHLDRVAMGTNYSNLIFNTLEERSKRKDPFWWLSYYRCSVCSENWIVAQDENYDDFYFKRISFDTAREILENKWPNVFEVYERLSLEVSQSSIFSRY